MSIQAVRVIFPTEEQAKRLLAWKREMDDQRATKWRGIVDWITVRAQEDFRSLHEMLVTARIEDLVRTKASRVGR